MEFGTPSRSSIKQLSNDVHSKHNLNLYTEPPDEDIDLLEIDELVTERLKVLKTLERLKERYKFMSTAFKEAFEKEISQIQPLFTQTCPPSKVAFYRRRDVISHFLLRLGSSFTPDLTKRFVSGEVDLLRVRFTNEHPARVMSFLAENNIKPNQVSDEERLKLANRLINGNRIKHEQLTATTFYKVPFVQCRELVLKRRVLLHRGLCYVTVNDLVYFLVQKFRVMLNYSMNLERTRLAELNENDRLLGILYQLVNEGSTSRTIPNATGREIRPEQVDELSRSSFPPCMRQIHSNLRENNHLKHFARQQYGLFLKGAGMSLDNSIAFFRNYFTRKMDMDKFTKNYVYNIRHMYGKEGNRVDHKPMSCSTIILNNPPGRNDCHGCPFKHADNRILLQRLQNMQIGKEKAEKIIKMASDEHRYDMACTRVFEHTHEIPDGALGCVITSPNEYFDLSRDIHEGKKEKPQSRPAQVLISHRTQV
ncbi:hypothetical protein M3Y94_00490400 [Aphelenchoides besseyi]|nr:hypothetical protein M3Y94_00490400 [Aphelenchoides besseyi]KAI6217907.1 Eukaryotic-type DNA primase, large subunit [Aphelenchoides besseyi]